MEEIKTTLAAEIAARTAWTDCSCSRNSRYACPHQRAYQEARVRRQQVIDAYIASGGKGKEATQ